MPPAPLLDNAGMSEDRRNLYASPTPSEPPKRSRASLWCGCAILAAAIPLGARVAHLLAAGWPPEVADDAMARGRIMAGLIAVNVAVGLALIVRSFRRGAHDRP
jgi:hypothetical protein